MDPNAALAEIRKLTGDFDRETDDERALHIASELVDRIQGLDVWLTRGGFAPTDWAQARVAPIDRTQPGAHSGQGGDRG